MKKSVKHVLWKNIEYYKDLRNMTWRPLIQGQCVNVSKEIYLNTTLEQIEIMAKTLDIGEYDMLFELDTPKKETKSYSSESIIKLFWENVDWHRQNKEINWSKLVGGISKGARNHDQNVSLEKIQKIADRLEIEDYAILFEKIE